MADTPKNASLDGLYRAVGAAISNWTRIEIQLHELFSIALILTVKQPGGGWSIPSGAPSAVLDAIDGFRAQLLMIDAALEASIGGIDDEGNAILSEWAVERKKVNGLHWNRNVLAHWTAVRLPMKNDRFVLHPPFYSTERHQGVTETDIQGWEKAFIEAADRLSKLVDRLASYQPLQRRFVLLTANQIGILAPHDRSLLELLERELSEHLKP